MSKIAEFNKAAEAINEAKTVMRIFAGDLTLDSEDRRTFDRMLKNAKYRKRLLDLAYMDTGEGFLYDDDSFDWCMGTAQEYADERERMALETEIMSEGRFTLFYSSDDDGCKNCYIIPGCVYLQPWMAKKDTLNDLTEMEIETECGDIMRILGGALEFQDYDKLFESLFQNKALRHILLNLTTAENLAMYGYETDGYCGYYYGQRVVEARARANTALLYHSGGELNLIRLPFHRFGSSDRLYIPTRSWIEFADDEALPAVQ